MQEVLPELCTWIAGVVEAFLAVFVFMTLFPDI